MKVQLFVSKDLEESHAEIYTDILTDNIQKAMVLLEKRPWFFLKTRIWKEI